MPECNRSRALAEKRDCRAMVLIGSFLNDGHDSQGLEQWRTIVLQCRERLRPNQP